MKDQQDRLGNDLDATADSAPPMFPDCPAIGTMSPEARDAKIQEIYEDQEFPSAGEYQQKRGWGWGPPKPWEYSIHKFGFIDSVDDRSGLGAIAPAERINPDNKLQDGRINIHLNALNIFEYPGSGEHEIMVTFKAQNQIATPELVTFSQVFRGVNDGSVGITGYPVFLGLNVGKLGVAFQVFTVNVKNKNDEAILDMLDSPLFRSGLNLLNAAQPAVKPLTELCTGLAKMMAARNKNVAVQDFYMGLDFNSNHLGARLAQGDYVAVQVPNHTAISWDQWTYDANIQTIRNKDDANMTLPFNYVIFNVSKDPES
jgi:hypothetical protein